MTTFVLVPGADGTAWFWHLLVPELRTAGHEAVTLALPTENSAGYGEFADAIVGAIDGRAESGPLVVVAQSLGGFSAPLACDRVRVDQLVLLNAMVPAPGESAADWWGNTGQPAARSAYAQETGRGPDPEFDARIDFFHDVPPEVTEEALAAEQQGPPAALFSQPWPLARWPHVPTRFLQARDDRFLPLTFQRRIARDRLGLDVEEVPGGHLAALSRPGELAAAILHGAPKD